MENKTGLQPVSRPVELVYYFEGWGVSAKSNLCKVLSYQDFADRQTYRTGSGARCTKVDTKYVDLCFVLTDKGQNALIVLS